MNRESRQLIKNFGYRFRHVLLLGSIGILAAFVVGALWSARHQRIAAAERQDEEVKLKLAAEVDRKTAEDQEQRAQQQRIDEQVRLRDLDEKRQDNQRRRKEEETRISEEAKAQKREYVSRYVRTTTRLSASDKASVAIALAGPNHNLDQFFATQLAALFSHTDVNASGTLFAPAFSTDGVMQRVLQSDAAEISRLDLPLFAKYVVLGNYQTQFSVNSQLENVITARTRLNVGVIQSESGALLESFSIDESGAGFTNDRAEEAAKERLLKSLSTRRWLFLGR